MLYDDESLDDLLLGGLRLIQPRAGYRFSIDAVLLAHFAPAVPHGVIVDLGSGSGVIPLLLSVLQPRAQIIGVELQAQMVRRARRSVELNRLAGRITLAQADIRTLEHSLKPAIAELALCNPPFWKENEGQLSTHPESAVARHELTLTPAELIPQAARILKDGGNFCLIHRAARLPELLTLLPAHRLRPRRLRPVYPQAGRPAALILLQAQKGSRGPLAILPPLILRADNGDWSPEITGWYKER